jgi:hypothetical protein
MVVNLRFNRRRVTEASGSKSVGDKESCPQAKTRWKLPRFTAKKIFKKVCENDVFASVHKV